VAIFRTMPVGISSPLAASFCFWKKKVVEREW
jgi:hypothetical protein